jgi:signal peptidase I
MLGTFCPGDRVTIEPVPIAEIRLGDVVAFSAPVGDKIDVMVHRVVAVTPRGLITRGDNNVSADAVPLTAENLLGKVTHYERNGVTRPVRGGRLGLMRAWVLHARIHIRNLAIFLGRAPYRLLRRSGIVPRVWHPRITQLRVNTDNGALVKYLHNGRVVARWWQQHHRFECAKPYDLVIARPDENSG